MNIVSGEKHVINRGISVKNPDTSHLSELCS
jgi:hypothetical protein